MDMILVSNIEGEGGDGMEVDGVKLQLDGSSTISNLDACYLEKDVIRFVVSDQNGILSVHDYTPTSKDVQRLGKDMSLTPDNKDGNKSSSQWKFEQRAGIRLDLYQADECGLQLILVAGKRGDLGSLCWFDLESLQHLCEYEFKGDEIMNLQEFEILNVAPLVPCILKETVMVAVTLPNRVVLLQGVLNIVLDDIALRSVHQLYTIEVGGDSQMHLIDITECASFAQGGFGLRYRIISESSISEYKEFHSVSNDTIARVRMLLACNDIEKADQIISDASKNELESPFGSVHSSEVVLQRFKRMIYNKKILTGERKDEVKECLQRLSFGAVSGGASGVKSLVEASRALHSWSSEVGPYIRDYRVALSVMARAVGNVLQGVSSKYTELLKNEKRILETKAGVFKTIETVLNSGEPKSLSSPLLQVKNHIELYQLLISMGAFKGAESVRQAEVGTKTITPEVVASSVTKISPKVDPNAYCAWLQNVVFPGITINHYILDTIFAWACEMADSFDLDASYGIDASISLLETIRDAVAKLNVTSHGSFSSYSPFSGNLASDNAIPLQINLNESVDSQLSSNSRSRDHSLLNSALKVASGKDMDLDKSSIVEERQFSIQTKLLHAQIIKAARVQGMSSQALRLSSFWKDGGAASAAKELVRLFFTTAWGDYLGDHTKEKEDVEEFCRVANVSFDVAVEQYSKDLCSQENIDATTLSRANDLVYACSNPDIKCKITLRFVRTAQISSSKPSCLKVLAKEAVQWATNEELRFELQEASRLLGIDEILRQYCGNSAPEVFRVSDPVHSARLVEYVSQKVNSPSVLSDILYLCSAFTHLSATDHCSSLIERVIEESLTQPLMRDQSTSLFDELQSIDAQLAETVAVRVCTFCVDEMQNLDQTIGAISEHARKRHEGLCAAAIALCQVATDKNPQGLVLKLHKSLCPATFQKPWADLTRHLHRIHELNKEFRVSISLSTLRSWKFHDNLMLDLVQNAINSSEGDRTAKSLELELTKARRGCSLLFGSDDCTVITSRWCKAVGRVSCNLVAKGGVDSCMMLLAASGLLDEIHNPSAYEAIISVSETLCSKASDPSFEENKSMKSVILANSLLNEHALVFCPASLLPNMMFLSNLVDVAAHMILKSDCGVGEKMEAYKHVLLEKSRCRRKPSSPSITNTSHQSSSINKYAISLHPSWHTSDGLLLPPMEALAECMNYCKGLLSITSGNRAPFFLNVHDFLESRGAHSISLRMLACASVVVSSKWLPKNNDTIFDQQAVIMQKIFFHLAERSLGGSGTGNTNARIDYHMAVPSLLNLHVKVAFKVRN